MTDREQRLSSLLRYVRSGEPDLTQRQMAVLMIVCWTPGPHTVRGVAATLGVERPVICRALDKFAGPDLGFLRRVRDEDDRRNLFIVALPAGLDFLERVG